jgi:hypothetical protein
MTYPQPQNGKGMGHSGPNGTGNCSGSSRHRTRVKTTTASAACMAAVTLRRQQRNARPAPAPRTKTGRHRASRRHGAPRPPRRIALPTPYKLAGMLLCMTVLPLVPAANAPWTPPEAEPTATATLHALPSWPPHRRDAQH